MAKEGLTTSSVLTPEALENAVIVEHALGGSSNAVFHLLALAEELDVGETINVDMIEKWGRKIPCLSNVMPSGKYAVTELDEVGGTLGVMKQVEQYLHKNALMVNGKTVGQNLESVSVLDSDIIRSLDNPVYDRGLAIVSGNLATSAVVRYSVFPEALRKYEGPAKVFDSQEEAREGVRSKKIKRGDVIVIRYEGPRGGPGMPDLLNLMYDLHGADLSTYCPLITDAKFSGFAKGPFICQLTPEAAVGGPLAAVRDNDVVEIDLPNNRVDVRITDDELQKRLAEWKPMEPKVKSGYLTLWARMANSAAKGAGLPYRI
jgi:dihydroxy-acid dehydratase